MVMMMGWKMMGWKMMSLVYCPCLESRSIIRSIMDPWWPADFLEFQESQIVKRKKKMVGKEQQTFVVESEDLQKAFVLLASPLRVKWWDGS